MVKQVKTDAEFVQEKAHGVVVVDFFAHWCKMNKTLNS